MAISVSQTRAREQIAFTSSRSHRKQGARRQSRSRSRQRTKLLKTASVSSSVGSDYQTRVENFRCIAGVDAIPWTRLGELDTMLVAYFEVRYLEGYKADDAEKTLAALAAHPAAPTAATSTITTALSASAQSHHILALTAACFHTCATN